VLSFSDTDVAQLTIYREGKTYKVERKKEKKEGVEREVWRMTEPVEAPADSSTISDILWDFSRLSVDKFVAEAPKDLKKYGLDKPEMRVTVTMKKEEDEEKPKQYVLLVGKSAGEDEGHYAKLADEDLVFVIKPSFYEYLTAELRDHKVLEFDKDDVTGLTLSYQDGTIKLERTEKDDEKVWKVISPEGYKLDKDKADDLLDYLDDLETKRYVQYEGKFKKQFGLVKPQLVIEISLEGEEKETLRIGNLASDKENYYASTADESGAVFLLSKDDIDKWLSKGLKSLAEEEKEAEKEREKAEKKEEKPAAKAKPEAKKPAAKAAPAPKEKPAAKPKEAAKPKPAAKAPAVKEKPQKAKEQARKKPEPKPEAPKAASGSSKPAEKKASPKPPAKKPVSQSPGAADKKTSTKGQAENKKAKKPEKSGKSE